MNSQDFHDWKRHPVTQAVYSHLAQLIQEGLEEVLEQTPYISHVELAEKTGGVKAFRRLLEMSYEDTKDGN